ncbi:alpha-ribazole phosphatase family protein [Pseudomonas sp. NCCP-436]|uniref:alpha-ribazole phosphatase family protein n=1 Tax=Pseudomonas sp. NCCP-436 TaxID=2842481 RepID=UPI001C800EF7|nr:alpha-ribazole phosphatase family protein [Pseudomonas sp. NCCP-436]GIZ11663.1 phosphoglycerate mutase [Pseudomonas sp. NCCP-436]
MSLYLIRHTRVGCAPGLCYGQLDVPLAKSFAEEAHAVRESLAVRFPAGLPPVWSSPSQRCRALADALLVPYRVDPRLMELNFGLWEGRTWAELDSPQARHWADHWQSAAPPGGESLPELLARLQSFLGSIPHSDVLLITHAGPIRALHHLVVGESLDKAFARPVDHGHLLTLPLDQALHEKH